MIVLKGSGLANRSCTTLDGFLMNARGIINSEGNILDTIAVLGNVVRELLAVLGESRLEGIDNVTVANNMNAGFTVASLKALVELTHVRI